MGSTRGSPNSSVLSCLSLSPFIVPFLPSFFLFDLIFSLPLLSPLLPCTLPSCSPFPHPAFGAQVSLSLTELFATPPPFPYQAINTNYSVGSTLSLLVTSVQLPAKPCAGKSCRQRWTRMPGDRVHPEPVCLHPSSPEPLGAVRGTGLRGWSRAGEDGMRLDRDGPQLAARPGKCWGASPTLMVQKGGHAQAHQAGRKIKREGPAQRFWRAQGLRASGSSPLKWEQ